MTAYEALFGRRPFVGTNVEDLAASMSLAPPIPEDSDVPVPVRDAVLRGLSRDRTRRWPSMIELLDRLDTIVRVTEVEAYVARMPNAGSGMLELDGGHAQFTCPRSSTAAKPSSPR